MSVLNRIKSLVFNEMRTTSPEVRRAIVKVWNRIDSELDEEGYTASSHILDAIIELDNVLVDVNYDNDTVFPLRNDPDIIIQTPKVIKRNEEEE